MQDQYGRKINYIRISVTDRCNLRCTYCMPAGGVEQVPHQEILTYDEIIRVSRLCASKGISRVKITGGEPLVRKGLASLIEALCEIEGIEQVTLTTNGLLLKEQAASLVQAGLSAVNISLDTLDREMYKRITRRDELGDVLEGIEEALSYPELKVKVNCVPLKDVNEGQWVALAGFAKDRALDVRFIEMMPIGLGRALQGHTQEEVLGHLRVAYGKERWMQGEFGNGPSTYVQFPGFAGKIGFISALSHQFCRSCNRVRLTAEGFLKPCLQYAQGVDLRGPLRAGETDERLEELIQKVIYEKPCSHHFEQQEQIGFEERQMSRIGG